MKKIFAIAITTISILIFVLSITIMVLGTKAMKDNKLLYIGDYSFSIIPSSSMEGDLADSLFPGDIAIINKETFDSVEIGDIIVFQEDSVLFIHRVIDIKENGELIAQGDNVPNDQTQNVEESEYQGTFSSKISFMRPIVLLLFSSRGFVFMILFIIILVMLIMEIVHILKTIHEEKKKLDEQKHLEEMEALMQVDKQKIYEEILAEEKQKNQQK